MPEVANCPVCGEEPRIEDEDYPYYSYHCCGHAVYADDKVATQWNRYASAMESQAKLDELCERVAWLLECEDYLLFLNPTNRWRICLSLPRLGHIVNAARKAVEELL